VLFIDFYIDHSFSALIFSKISKTVLYCIDLLYYSWVLAVGFFHKVVAKSGNTFVSNALSVLSFKRPEEQAILKKNNPTRKYSTFISLVNLNITNFTRYGRVSFLLKDFYKFSAYLNMSTRQFFSKNIFCFKDSFLNFFLPDSIKIKLVSLALYKDFLNFNKYLGLDRPYRVFSVLPIERSYMCYIAKERNNYLGDIFSEGILQSSFIFFKNNFERNFIFNIFDNNKLGKEKRWL